MSGMVTISQVSKAFSVTTRMLRHYEKMGLLSSRRADGYAYRVYDEEALMRLQQIIVLRKLRISLKDIDKIFASSDAQTALNVFMRSVNEIDSEMTALETMRSILSHFIDVLKGVSEISLQSVLLNDEAMCSAINALSIIKHNFKEDKTMSELNQASEKMTKLADHEVRIINLPPMTVAAFCAAGENCEGKAAETVDQFVKESGLLEIKPDARSFGFDCSKEFQGIGELSQAYEVWVSVPDDMDVPLPLKKIQFDGGLYAAHVLMNWDFEMWRYLREWVAVSSKYDNNAGEQPSFDERLNYYNLLKNGGEPQLDLLFPIKLKE